jgi:hypothetical protein
MQNNKFELIGDICGNLKLLKQQSDEQVAKVELIIIPNDILDKKGKPNSLRCHAYFKTALDIYKNLQSGDKVKLEGYIKRTILNDKVKPIVYGTDLVVEKYELIRRPTENTDEIID